MPATGGEHVDPRPSSASRGISSGERTETVAVTRCRIKQQRQQQQQDGSASVFDPYTRSQLSLGCRGEAATRLGKQGYAALQVGHRRGKQHFAKVCATFLLEYTRHAWHLVHCCSTRALGTSQDCSFQLQVLAKRALKSSAEERGVSWDGHAKRLMSDAELKQIKEEMENKSMVYPSYYLQPFHACESQCGRTRKELQSRTCLQGQLCLQKDIRSAVALSWKAWHCVTVFGGRKSKWAFFSPGLCIVELAVVLVRKLACGTPVETRENGVDRALLLSLAGPADDEGNLNWLAACEVEPATYAMAIRTFKSETDLTPMVSGSATDVYV
eukprot:1138678-Pelagomonas_calceolata.AAC.15